MKKLVLLLSLTLLTACQPEHSLTKSVVDDTVEEIAGGTKVTRFDSLGKHMAHIFVPATKTVCTGTIIAPNLILTAAHCISNPGYPLEIGFGLDWHDGNMEIRAGRAVIKHSGFAGAQSNFDRDDIALISFSGSLPDGFKPAPLVKDTTYTKENGTFTAFGYGSTTGMDGIGNSTGRLRKVPMTIFSVFSNKKVFASKHLSGKGVCFGDSGGAAFVKIKGVYHLMGVIGGVYWSQRPKDQCSAYSYYLSIPYYLPWIREKSLQLR
ncbi:S1 family peptidase [Bdellovibrio sp. HCB274]|uniref:S1 family peptidase n=1 Tax=Bdellovibrio sp. HCB274 TaxID=3394361 RepID=UPI0039B4A1BC